MMMRRLPLRALVVILLAVVAGTGCWGSNSTQGLDLGGDDANKIGVLIDDINEAKGNAKRVAALFASGAKPPDGRKLSQFDYSLAGRPSVSGDTATCKVKVDSPKGGSGSDQEWSFVKEGDKWKIKTAPLP